MQNLISNIEMTLSKSDLKIAKRYVDKKEILKDQNARLNVQLFVKENRKEVKNFDLFFNEWEENSKLLKNSIEKILEI